MYVCECEDQLHVAHRKCLAILQHNCKCLTCGIAHRTFQARWMLIKEVFCKTIRSDINVRNNIISTITAPVHCYQET